MFFKKKMAVAEKPAPAPAAEPVKDKPESAEPRKKILVIDDDAVIVKALSMGLKSRGYDVVAAADGAQAIAMMQQERPDMMVVDVCLAQDVSCGGVGHWDGFQVTRWLQRMNSARIPAIIISGTNKPEYKEQAAAVGADDFLPKPLNLHVLLGCIATSLSKARPAEPEFGGLKMAGSN
jgi:two-component system KDP operon response regulator KdpE